MSQARQILDNDAALRSGLRGLPRPAAPAGLTTNLRVIASRERQRNVRRQSVRAILEAWRERLHFRFENVMRPLAVPVAGGLFSAVALFTTFVAPTYPVRAQHAFDVPTQLSTEARVKDYSTIGHADGDVLVEVTVDEKGQMVDYQIIAGATAEPRHLENFLVFTTFVPATTFGRPISSKLRLWLSSAYIDVKG